MSSIRNKTRVKRGYSKGCRAAGLAPTVGRVASWTRSKTEPLQHTPTLSLSKKMRFFCCVLLTTLFSGIMIDSWVAWKSRMVCLACRASYERTLAVVFRSQASNPSPAYPAFRFPCPARMQPTLLTLTKSDLLANGHLPTLNFVDKPSFEARLCLRSQ